MDFENLLYGRLSLTGKSPDETESGFREYLDRESIQTEMVFQMGMKFTCVLKEVLVTKILQLVNGLVYTLTLR